MLAVNVTLILSVFSPKIVSTSQMNKISLEKLLTEQKRSIWWISWEKVSVTRNREGFVVKNQKMCLLNLNLNTVDSHFPLMHLWKASSLLQIVGGTETRVGEFPFSVLIGGTEKKCIKINRGKEVCKDIENWVCSGVLLNNLFVLTAAHCKDNFAENLKLRLGIHFVAGEKEQNHSGIWGFMTLLSVENETRQKVLKVAISRAKDEWSWLMRKSIDEKVNWWKYIQTTLVVKLLSQLKILVS